jgi:hypothetical protein
MNATSIATPPYFTLTAGSIIALAIGAVAVTGLRDSAAFPVLFILFYVLLTVLQVLSFTVSSQAAWRQGGGSAVAWGFTAVAIFAAPICMVAVLLLTLDLVRNWRLASNPVSLILYFSTLRFLMARNANRQSATALLRGTNLVSAADGVAAQRRQDAPDFSRAERPVDAAPRSPLPNLDKASAPSFADAVRPADED